MIGRLSIMRCVLPIGYRDKYSGSLTRYLCVSEICRWLIFESLYDNEKWWRSYVSVVARLRYDCRGT